MVSNMFLGALAAKLGFHKHLRSNGATLEYQVRTYVNEIEEAKKESNGARDYWTSTQPPPKVNPPTLSALILITYYSLSVSSRHPRSLHRRHLRRLRIQLRRSRALLHKPYPILFRRHDHLRYFRKQASYRASSLISTQKSLTPHRPISTISSS